MSFNEFEEKWADVKEVPGYQISNRGLLRHKKDNKWYYQKLPKSSRSYRLYLNGKLVLVKSPNKLMERYFNEYQKITKNNIDNLLQRTKELCEQEGVLRKERGSIGETTKQEGELLGPEEPLLPKRKCHEKGCNVMGYTYWCDDHRPEEIKHLWETDPGEWHTMNKKA